MPTPPHVLITSGAAWEPIDGMRRLSNASTGHLGTQLAEFFVAAGLKVILFRAETAVAAPPAGDIDRRTFSTNDDLARQLAQWPGPFPEVVLHAAALCDFRVAGARTLDGQTLSAGKLSSRDGAIQLDLVPATKVLPQLQSWFPKARIVGWKYEVDGDATSALDAASRQLREADTQACVVNGPAWGPGFGWLTRNHPCVRCATANDLAATLLDWIKYPDTSAS